MWLAKIGGSLHGDPRLGAWLTALRTDTQRRWLLVPGGGPYADAIRREQQILGYDDREAHVRAIAAMARYAEDLLHLAPMLRPARGVAACVALAAAADAGAALWCPIPEDIDAFPTLPTDWRVTSDSLAHALARHLSATALLLVKSVAPPDGGVASMAQAGYVDAWLPRLLPAATGLAVYWAVAPPPMDTAAAASWPPAGQRLRS